jgi:hypothetical protein
VDNVAVENIFSSMIEYVLTGQKTIEKALQEAEGAISNLMRQNFNRL